MKTNNIFDRMDKETEVNEQTVIEETGVSTDKVKELFGEMVKNNGKTKAVKKRKTKKVITVIAAAIAAVLALGTITAGATGSFNGVFGKMFSGEAADGMYSGGSVDISSNIVNVDFKGIAGDNEEVFGLMNMTKKDGTAFFEGDAKEYFVVSDQQNDGVDSSVTCTRSLSDQISAKLFYHADSGIGSMMYNVVDNNTIEAIFGYSDTEFNIIGETLSFNEDHVTLYHIDETFMTGKEYFETFNEHSDKNDPFWSDGLSIFEKLEKQYGKKLNDNQMIYFDNNGNVSLLSSTKLDIDLNGSVKLNYKDTSRKITEAEGIKTTFSGSEVTVRSLDVRPFSVRLELEYPTADTEELADIHDKQSPNAVNSITVTMKNGKSYTSDNSPGFGSDNTERLTFSFSDKTRVVIDPQQISRIVYNGTTLYSA